MHPGVSYPLERVVPQGGADLCGTHLPAGTVVGVNAAVIHRNRDIFGEDANQFRPERWVCDEEKIKEMDRNLLTVSAMNPSPCPSPASRERASSAQRANVKFKSTHAVTSSELAPERASGRTFQSWRSASLCLRSYGRSTWSGHRVSPSGK